ncbi:MAG: hypothetical protein HXS45_03545 [Theionarchaea archaeon]|nr:hypothetical protein [Theionarchaea archaeon]
MISEKRMSIEKANLASFILVIGLVNLWVGFFSPPTASLFKTFVTPLEH